MCDRMFLINQCPEVKMCHLCFVMLSSLACSGGLCISFIVCFWLLLPMPAGVDAEFHTRVSLLQALEV